MKSILLAFVVISCTVPDEVHVGTGYRDEELGVTPYSGATGWIEGVWKLKPTEISLDTETKLFLRGQDDASHDVTVNVPAAADDPTDLQVLLSQGQDADGNWTPWGAGVVIAVLVFWLEKQRRGRKTKEAAA